MSINRAFFYESVRDYPFAGKLRQSQVAGMESILDVWESSDEQRDDRWLAYMLATAFHETACTMQPVKEYGGRAWYMKNYDVTGANPTRARKMGNTVPGDGALYCGRGYVQLTWKTNYARLSEIVGVDLVEDPEAAMRPEIACKIMFHGMLTGMFTGRKLMDFFNTSKADWVRARSIINGTDRAELVASYAKGFYSAISYTV